MPDNKKIWFNLPIPGLSTCPPKDTSAHDEMLVEIAKSNLIGLLSDPYNYEALQHLIQEKHRLTAPVGGPHQRKGKISRKIIDSFYEREKKDLGRPKIHRPGLDNLLAYIEKEQQKLGKKRSLEWHSNEIVKTIYSGISQYKKKKLSKELYLELSREKRRQQYRNRRK